MSDPVASEEPYLLVEEVAEQLGLPLAVLLRRVEAGDIPSQRVERDDGVHFALRLGDLGIPGADSRLATVFDRGQAVRLEGTVVRSAPLEGEPGAEPTSVDVTGRRVAAEPEPRPLPVSPFSGTPPAHAQGTRAEEEAPQPQAREEAQPAQEAQAAEARESPEAPRGEARTGSPPSSAADTSSATEEAEPQVGLLSAAEPRGDLAAMSLDARELVAGLLDRWERTLEQRIYTEQRQRFQGELASRQNMVKQLQMELQTARAEHAAAQAEKDRQLAERDRDLAERERLLAEARHRAYEAETLLAPAAAAHRRRWFWQRGDG